MDPLWELHAPAGRIGAGAAQWCDGGVTIGPDGYAEWRAVLSDVTPVQVTITTTGAWHLYDPAFTTVANGKGSDVACLPAGNGLRYLTIFGDPGQTITVAVQ